MVFWCCREQGRILYKHILQYCLISAYLGVYSSGRIDRNCSYHWKQYARECKYINVTFKCSAEKQSFLVPKWSDPPPWTHTDMAFYMYKIDLLKQVGSRDRTLSQCSYLHFCYKAEGIFVRYKATSSAATAIEKQDGWVHMGLNPIHTACIYK